MNAKRKITVADLQRSVKRTQRVLSTEEFKTRIAAIRGYVGVSPDSLEAGAHRRANRMLVRTASKKVLARNPAMPYLQTNEDIGTVKGVAQRGRF